MSAFAYISILEAIGSLAIALLIRYTPIDRLFFYGLMLCLLAVIIRLIYGFYCKRHFKECKYTYVMDKMLIKEMFGFAGWNMIGTSSAILRTQGNSILINLFFGPAVNGAQAIAVKIDSIVSSFVQNFMLALNPQITKSYAAGDLNNMFKLVFQGSRFSFYLILLISLPVLLNAHFILVMWLGQVPDYTTIFVELILVLALSESLSHTLVTTLLAIGRIKKYMIIVGGLQMLNVPINLALFKLGSEPFIIYIVAVVISQLCLFARLIILKHNIGFDVKLFLKKVYRNVFLVFSISCLFPIFVYYILEESFVNFFVISFVSFISVVLVEYYIGLSKEERKYLINKMRHISY